MGKNFRKNAGLFLLAAFYFLVSIRYVPVSALDTFTKTLFHLLTAVPIVFGATLVVASLLKKISSGFLARRQILRLYFSFGILLEIFFGLYDYLSRHQPPGTGIQ